MATSKLPVEARGIPGKPYVVLVPRPEFNDALLTRYAIEVPTREGDVIVFNNQIEYDSRSGETRAIAHGATSITAFGDTSRRDLILSFAHD